MLRNAERSPACLEQGRETKESRIDFFCGNRYEEKTGDRVTKGETVAVLHTSQKELARAAAVPAGCR